MAERKYGQAAAETLTQIRDQDWYARDLSDETHNQVEFIDMDLTETSVALGACVVLLIVAVVLDRRPYRPGKLNYIPLMIICLAACLVLGRHLLSLIRQR